MTNKIIGALALALALTAARANARTEDGVVDLPQLQLTEMTGEVRVQAPNQPETVTGQKLPYIRSGSLVQVLSGRAEFESDYHAIIRAKKGDGFRFTATAPEGSKAGVVRIAAVTEGEPPSLNVRVGDKRFRLHKNGVLTVAGSAPGESVVRVEGGNVQYPAVEVRREGELMAATHGMLPDQPLVVSVSSATEFETAPVSLSSLAIEKKNATTFDIRATQSAETAQAPKDERADRAISRWPSGSQRVAELIINKYGLPDKASSSMLVWNDNGPWQKTVVYRTGAQHGFPQNHEDVIRQSITYEVPREKAAELAKMDIGVTVDGDYKGLSSLSDSEETNFLAINLADEVIRGQRTAEDARDFYAKTIALSGEGKSSAYTQWFLFQRP